MSYSLPSIASKIISSDHPKTGSKNNTWRNKIRSSRIELFHLQFEFCNSSVILIDTMIASNAQHRKILTDGNEILDKINTSVLTSSIQYIALISS